MTSCIKRLNRERATAYLFPDVVITCSGFEERGLRGSELIDKQSIRRAFILAYHEDEPRAGVLRNTAQLKANYEAGGASAEVVSCSLLDPTLGLDALMDRVTSTGNGDTLVSGSVAVDVTTMTKPYFFLLLARLREVRGQQPVEIVYTLPDRYPEPDAQERHTLLAPTTARVGVIPGFPGSPSAGAAPDLVIQIGFEPHRTQAIMDDVQPHSLVCVQGCPGSVPGWDDRAVLENADLMKRTAESEASVVQAAADDPFENEAALSDVQAALRGRQGAGPDTALYVAPLGTKPQALGACLFALANPRVTVIYPYPPYYVANYSTGFRETLVYQVVLPAIG